MSWRDVVSNSHSRPAQCKRFAYLVLDADATAHNFFGMNTNDNFPTKNAFDNTLAKRSASEWLSFLNDIVKKFLCKYISDPKLHTTYLQNINIIQEWKSQGNTQRSYFRWQVQMCKLRIVTAPINITVFLGEGKK